MTTSPLQNWKATLLQTTQGITVVGTANVDALCIRGLPAGPLAVNDHGVVVQGAAGKDFTADVANVVSQIAPVASNVTSLIAKVKALEDVDAQHAAEVANINTKVASIVVGLQHATPAIDITDAPPAAPKPFEFYIVGAAPPSGAFAGHAHEVATWTGSAWVFETPAAGETRLVEAKAGNYTWNGTAWAKISDVTSIVPQLAQIAAQVVTLSANVEPRLVALESQVSTIPAKYVPLAGNCTIAGKITLGGELVATGLTSAPTGNVSPVGVDSAGNVVKLPIAASQMREGGFKPKMDATLFDASLATPTSGVPAADNSYIVAFDVRGWNGGIDVLVAPNGDSIKVNKKGFYLISFTYSVGQNWGSGGVFHYITKAAGDRDGSLALGFTNTINTITAWGYFNAGDDVFFGVDIPAGSGAFLPQATNVCGTGTVGSIAYLGDA